MKLNISKIVKDRPELIMGELLVASAEVKTTTTGRPFTALVLMDGENRINAKIWNCSQPPKEGVVISLTGKPNIYNNEVSIIIDSYDETDYPVEDYYEHGPLGQVTLFANVNALIEMIKNEDLKSLVSKIFSNYTKLWMQKPSAVSHHHNYIGGNLQHSYEVATTGLTLAHFYKEECKMDLDLDVIIAGGLIHDLGKLWCYEINSGVASANIYCALQDHIVMGYYKLMEIATGMNLNVESPWFMKLSHIITSHHGLKEYGSPVQPAIPEAVIVSEADMISFKMAAMNNELKQIDEMAQKRSFIFGNYLCNLNK